MWTIVTPPRSCLPTRPLAVVLHSLSGWKKEMVEVVAVVVVVQSDRRRTRVACASGYLAYGVRAEWTR